MNRTVRLVALAFCGWALVGCQSANVQPDASTGPQTEDQLADIHTQLGVGYLREGKLDLAWKRLHRALEYDPGYSTAHTAMGTLYEKLGDPAKAEEHYAAATQLNPGDSAAQNNYGQFLCRNERYEEAEQRFMQALKNTLYDSPQAAYTNAGLCAKMAGDVSKADAYLRRALEIDPKLPAALLSMAEVSMDNERTLSARAYLQRYLAVAKHTSRSLWLGVQIERELGDADTASSYAMLLRSRYPDSDEARRLESTLQ